ncbi:hypothetical protein [Microbacterium sp. XT11]|uniref:hypothetical protein n=1 Tax=Microbacterium sp. XT11 TaxID=367477 RepID=UPI00082ACF63|nr:hypothetical protein [Microbacterium sp. XT11]
MTDVTATAPPQRAAPLWRRLLRSPVLWGLLLLATAVALTAVHPDLGLLPFLCVLVGGWLLGVAFVARTYRMPRHGSAVHVSGALVTASVLVVLTVGDVLAGAPAAVRHGLLMLQLGAIPAAAWIWLGLLGRITGAVGRSARRRVVPRAVPRWEPVESGEGSVVRFAGVPLRMRRLVVVLAGAVAAVGAATAGTLIVLDDAVMRVGPRLSIVVLAVVLGLPAYLVIAAVLRRRTVPCTVTVGAHDLRVAVGESVTVIRLAEITHLRWRTRSEYARVEARGGGADVSVFAGMAATERGVAAELPPLSRRAVRSLEHAGLSMTTSRRGDVVTFRRA